MKKYNNKMELIKNLFNYYNNNNNNNSNNHINKIKFHIIARMMILNLTIQ